MSLFPLPWQHLGVGTYIHLILRRHRAVGMNLTIEFQTRPLLEFTVTTVRPPSVSCADSSTASVGCEEGGFLVTTSVCVDSHGLSREDVGISACVVPHIDALGLAGTVVASVGGDHVGQSPGAEAEECEGLSEMHGCLGKWN